MKTIDQVLPRTGSGIRKKKGPAKEKSVANETPQKTAGCWDVYSQKKHKFPSKKLFGEERVVRGFFLEVQFDCQKCWCIIQSGLFDIFVGSYGGWIEDFPSFFFLGGGGWRLAVESLRYEGLDRWKVKLSTMIAVCPGKLTWQSFQEEMYRNISSKGLWRCMFHCHVCLAKGYMNLNVYSWWFRNSKPRTWDGHKTRR